MQPSLRRRPSRKSCPWRPTATLMIISVTSLFVFALFQVPMKRMLMQTQAEPSPMEPPLVEVKAGANPGPPGLLRGVESVPDQPAAPVVVGGEIQPKGMQVGPVTAGLLPKSPLQLDCHQFLAAEEASPESAGIRADNPFEIVRTRTSVPFDMSIYPVELDKWVSGGIKGGGCWECGLVQTVVGTLQQHASSFLLDIGGNIGMMSLSAAAAGHDVYVWEPFRANFRHMCRSVEANAGFSDRIHLFNRALTRKEMIVHFRDLGDKGYNKGGIGVSEASDGGEGLLSPSAENVDYARGVTMDSLIPWLPPAGRPLVIKVDVEAAELEALAGAMEYLRQHQGNILFVVIEVNYAALEARPNDADTVFQFFRSNGLKPYCRGAELANDWRDWNFIGGDTAGVCDVSWIKPSDQTS